MEQLTYTGIDRTILDMVDPASIAAVDGAAHSHPNASVIIVEGPSDTVATVVALRGAETAAGVHAQVDVRVAAPNGDRWTVDELATNIVDPASMRPNHRNHIVVASADKMATLAADRLLKVTEEPSAPTTFWFAVTDTSRLLTTLRGRATDVIVCGLIDPTARAQHLADTHEIPLDVAERIVELCGDEVTIANAAAAAAATSPDTLTAFSDLFATAMPDEQPISAALRVSGLIDTVAGDLGGNAADRKVFVRQLTRMQLDRWVRDARNALSDQNLPARAYASVTRRLVAIDDAHFSLGVSIAPSDVIAAAFATAAGDDQ